MCKSALTVCGLHVQAVASGILRGQGRVFHPAILAILTKEPRVDGVLIASYTDNRGKKKRERKGSTSVAVYCGIEKDRERYEDSTRTVLYSSLRFRRPESPQAAGYAEMQSAMCVHYSQVKRATRKTVAVPAHN